MKRVLMTLAFCLALSPAAMAGKAANPQQAKMKACNGEAAKKDLKGDERKAFMSECLGGEAPAKALTPQQQRMKDCNAEAKSKSLKGDERKAFMSTCLKAK